MWKLAVINVSVWSLQWLLTHPFSEAAPFWVKERAFLKRCVPLPSSSGQQTLQGIVNTARDKPGLICATCTFQFVFGKFSKSVMCRIGSIEGVAGLCPSKSPRLRVWRVGWRPRGTCHPEEREQRHRHWAFPALSKGASGLVALGGILRNSAEICLRSRQQHQRGRKHCSEVVIFILFVNIVSSLELSIPYNFWQSTAVGNMFKTENTLRDFWNTLCLDALIKAKQTQHNCDFKLL